MLLSGLSGISCGLTITLKSLFIRKLSSSAKLFGVSRFWISRANFMSDFIFQPSQHAEPLESLFGVMDVLGALVQCHVLQRILRPNLHKVVESRWVRQRFLLNTNSIMLASSSGQHDDWTYHGFASCLVKDHVTKKDLSYRTIFACHCCPVTTSEKLLLSMYPLCRRATVSYVSTYREQSMRYV